MDCQIELAEVRAWEDMYAAAPASFRALHALEASRAGGALVLTSRGLHLAHFNSVLGAGAMGAVDVSAIVARFAPGTRFYFHTVEGDAVESLLAARGLRVVSSWDRVIRGGEPLGSDWDFKGIECVTTETAAEWAAFIDGVYHLPTGPWLQSIAVRDGWSHWVLREDGAIVAARSMFIDRDGYAWWGIDAPVPGIMTPRYDRDQRLCARMIAEGLAMGARGFGADIEKPSDPSGAEAFSALGFRVAYRRNNFMP